MRELNEIKIFKPILKKLGFGPAAILGDLIQMAETENKPGPFYLNHSDLAIDFRMSKSTVGRHLTDLEQEGLVSVETIGKKKFYTVNFDKLNYLLESYKKDSDDANLN